MHYGGDNIKVNLTDMIWISSDFICYHLTEETQMSKGIVKQMIPFRALVKGIDF